MGLVNGMKLGLAINSKLDKVSTSPASREATLKALLESVQGKGRFTVVGWSILGKKLEVFGNGKE